jgi:cytosine/adenosine deaminase-related metal-dependent hydrolase
VGFVDWVREVMASRRANPETPHRAIGRGIEEAIRTGTTTLGEIAQPGWSPELFERAGCGVVAFLELIAPTIGRVPDALDSARRHVTQAGSAAAWRPGLCPHSPYSVHPSLLHAIVDWLADAGIHVPLAFHLAESREELELLRFGAGPFRDFLSEIPGWDESMLPRSARPIDYLRLLARAERSLVIHGNYLDDEEIGLLAASAERMAVVYCPRTHAHFGHDPYPLEKMLSAGATVALGTDSRASSPDLSMLAEMRAAARRHPAVPRSTILRLATLHAAQGLGLIASIGALSSGKRADLAIVRLPDRDAVDPHDLLFDFDEPVVATWIGGVKREPSS